MKFKSILLLAATTLSLTLSSNVRAEDPAKKPAQDKLEATLSVGATQQNGQGGFLFGGSLLAIDKNMKNVQFRTNLNVGKIGDKIIGTVELIGRFNSGPIFFTYSPLCIDRDTFMDEMTIGIRKLGIGVSLADGTFEVSTGIRNSEIMANQSPLGDVGNASLPGYYVSLTALPLDWMKITASAELAQSNESLFSTGNIDENIAVKYNKVGVKIECELNDKIKFYSEFQIREFFGDYTKTVYVSNHNNKQDGYSSTVQKYNNSITKLSAGLSYSLGN